MRPGSHNVVQKDKKAKLRYGSYIMYMILQRTGLPESVFDITVKTSKTQLRPQADDNPDEVVVPALFGDPSDAVVPATVDTAESSSPPHAQEPQPQEATGVTGEDPPSDTAEYVSVTQVHDDGTTSSTLMTPEEARAY